MTITVDLKRRHALLFSALIAIDFTAFLVLRERVSYLHLIPPIFLFSYAMNSAFLTTVIILMLTHAIFSGNDLKGVKFGLKCTASAGNSLRVLTEASSARLFPVCSRIIKAFPRPSKQTRVKS